MSPPSLTTFSFEPIYLVAAVAACAMHLRTRPEGRLARLRRPLFAVGLVIAAGAVNSPLETVAIHSLLSAHLVQNAMIADWAPPLLIMGLSPAMREAVSRRLGRPFRELTRLSVAVPVWLCAWYGIHLPVLYQACLRHPQWLNLEHAVLFCAGWLFWWPILTDTPHAYPLPARLAYLLAGSLLAGPLAFVFIFDPDPIYAYYSHQPHLWGLSTVRDQQLGGIFMNVEQAVVFLIALAYLFTRWFREDAAAGSALDM